jgi:putative transposase
MLILNSKIANMIIVIIIYAKMAKSTLDARWSSLKTMLEYKFDCAGIVFEEIIES